MTSEQALDFHLDQADRHEEELFEHHQEQEIEMYGATSEALENSRPDYQDDIGEAFSWLSDAQEVLPGDPETARQFINRAKYFLSKVRGEHRQNNAVPPYEPSVW